jgi:hypothetical protein
MSPSAAPRAAGPCPSWSRVARPAGGDPGRTDRSGGAAEAARAHGHRLPTRADHGTAGTAADLAAAFEYLQQLRLHHQAERLTAGAVPDDAVPLAELTTLQRRWLKDTALLIHTCQESVRIAYRTDRIA